ncbi:GWxTD domain-containing protein [bacterium]|nr:GWxTD domain-containing protein [bacterium]
MRPLYVYYETYPREADRLDVYYRILDETGEVVVENSFDQQTKRPITRDYFTIDISSLSHGRYVIELQVRTRNTTALKGAQFRIKMAGLPNVINDLDTAIRQLRYIEKRKSVKEMLRSKGTRKETLFRKFWKERDPTENTAANELMEEYYWRVSRANQMFGSFRDGWETDRGEVFVRYGVPDQIERHPYSINSQPYEIWYYHRHNRRFVFVDEMGFGEYRLVTNLW